MERKHYFILRFLVTKYGKDSIINTVNKIVTNNVKENFNFVEKYWYL